MECGEGICTLSLFTLIHKLFNQKMFLPDAEGQDPHSQNIQFSSFHFGVGTLHVRNLQQIFSKMRTPPPLTNFLKKIEVFFQRVAPKQLRSTFLYILYMHFTFHIVKLKLNERENTSTEMHCAPLNFIRIYIVITLSLFPH